MKNLAMIDPVVLDQRLLDIRREVFSIELGLRGLVRIADQARESDLNSTHWALHEIQAIGEMLVALADKTGTAIEPCELVRWNQMENQDSE